MKEIYKNPDNYFLPDYCFEQKYKHYTFSDSSFLGGEKILFDAFFEILRLHEEKAIEAGETSNLWELLIPFDSHVRPKDLQGNYEDHFVNKSLQKFSLKDLKEYFKPKGAKFKINSTMLFPDFWIKFHDSICVYFAYNQEIMIIGSNVNVNVDSVLSISFLRRLPLPLKENPIIRVNGPNPYREVRLTVGEVFYTNFDEYVNHWGVYFRWDKSDIESLKAIFNAPAQ